MNTQLPNTAGNPGSNIIVALIQASAIIHQNGETPLHEAALFGHTQTALALIEKGAKVNATDGVGYTPLHWAAAKGHTQIALTLIEKGAIIRATNQDGYSPQRCAEEAGQIRTALAIMNAGKALVNSVTTVFPFFPNDPTALILEFAGVLHEKINLDDVVDCRRELTTSIAPTAG